MRVSVCQFQTVAGEYLKNRNKVLLLLNMVERDSIVVFPEVFATGFDYENLEGAAKLSVKLAEDMIGFSKGLNSVFVFTVIEKVNGKFFNSVKVVDNGKEVLSRPKIKLFSPFDEDKYFTAGKVSEDLKVVETSKGVIAPVICFELRFPEFFLYMLKKGAEIFTVTAQWGKARKEHFKILTRARAIEMQRFVVAANGIGDMAGSSVIIDPWGRTLKEAGESEGVISFQTDLNIINQVGRKLPMGR